jgi:hypothetical protein
MTAGRSRACFGRLARSGEPRTMRPNDENNENNENNETMRTMKTCEKGRHP